MRDRAGLLLTGAVCLIVGWLAAPRWSGHSTAQEPVGKPARAVYHMVLVSAGNGWEVLRYRPDNGETWIPKNMVWQKVAETDTPPAGECEVQAVGVPAVNAYEATRMERATGRTWVLRNSKWIEIGDSK